MPPKRTKKPHFDSNVNPPKNTKRPHRSKAPDALNLPQDLPPNTKPTNTTAKKKTSSTTSRPKESTEALLVLKSPCLDLLSNPLDSDLITPLPKAKLNQHEIQFVWEISLDSKVVSIQTEFNDINNKNYKYN